MTMDVRSKQQITTRKVEGTSPFQTLEQVGRTLWEAFKGFKSLITPSVPAQTKPAVMKEVTGLLGAGAAAVAGRLTEPHKFARESDKSIVADARRQLKDTPVKEWSDADITTSLQGAERLHTALRQEKTQAELFALPPGTTFHETGHLKSRSDNAPSHITVARHDWFASVDDAAAWLAGEAMRTGKPQATLINEHVVLVKAPVTDLQTSTRTAMQGWSANATSSQEKRDVDSLATQLRSEVTRRSADMYARSQAKLQGRIDDLAPGALLVEHSAGMYRVPPHVKLESGPFILNYDDAVAWTAIEAGKRGRTVAYRFNSELIVAAPATDEVATQLAALKGVEGKIKDPVRFLNEGIVADAQRLKTQRPVKEWSDTELMKTLHAADELHASLRQQRTQDELKALPAGTNLHVDGDLKSRADNAPPHIQVVKGEWFRSVDEAAGWLAGEAKKTGKPQATIINDHVVVVKPPVADPQASAKAATAAWHERAEWTPQETDAYALASECRSESARRSEGMAARAVTSFRAKLDALPPGTIVVDAQPETYAAVMPPHVKHERGPFIHQLEDAQKWVADESAKRGKNVVYRFNQSLLTGKADSV